MTTFVPSVFQENSDALISSSPDSPECPSTRTLKKFQPTRKLTPPQVPEAVALYRSGLSLGAIAGRMGVSRQSMHDLLKRRIQLRGRIEALPRKPQTAIRVKRLRTLRRYRSRASRITEAQIRMVFERDGACKGCGAPGKDVDHVVPVALGGQTGLWNLQLLCRRCHIEKSRRDRSAAATHRKSTSSLADSHAPTSLLRVSAPASPDPEAASSSSSPASQENLFGPEATFWSRTSPVSSVLTADGTFTLSSKRWPTSGFRISRGEYLTPNSSAFPSDGGVSSSLRDVLEETVAPKYFLSPRACSGIIRRATKRGKALPKHLEAALVSVAGHYLTPTE